MIRGGRNSHLWPAYRVKAGEAGQIKDYGIAATHSQPEIWPSADYWHTTGFACCYNRTTARRDPASDRMRRDPDSEER